MRWHRPRQVRPARGLLLVRPIEPEETYAGGTIIVPEVARQRLTTNQCECVAVGEAEQCIDWENCQRSHCAVGGGFSSDPKLKSFYHPCNLRVGDWLLVRPRSYLETGEPETKLWLVHQRDVLAILHE